MKFVQFLFLFLSIFYVSLSEDEQNPSTGSVTGRVKSATTQNPVQSATVQLLGTKSGTFTDKDGRFTIKKIPPGIYSLRVSCLGYESFTLSNVIITTARPYEADIDLAEKAVELKGAEIRANYFQRRIETATSTQSLDFEDIRRAPGVQEDVIRAASLLPGVGVASQGRNDLVVRGGAPFENLYIVDNIEIPNINHFGSQGSGGGPLAIINIDFVRDVEFSAGGFGARFGDKTSSMMNISLRNGSQEKFSGKAVLSATGFGLNLEGPVTDRGSVLFSVRRSYLDFIFKAAGFGFIPEYWDFHGKAFYRLDDKNSLTFLTIGALNNVKLNNDNQDNRFSNSRVLIPTQDQYFSGLSWRSLLGDGFLTVTLGRSFSSFLSYQNDSSLSEIFRNKSVEGEVLLKTDLEMQMSPTMGFVIGNQVKYASKLDYEIKIPGFIRKDNLGMPVGLNADTSFNALRNSTYASLTNAIGRLKLTIGGRMDYYAFLENKLYLSPRFSAVYTINEVTSLLFSAGRFYQPPSYIWLVGGYNSALKPILADQAVIGCEYIPLEDWKIQFEAYYKLYKNYPERVFRPQAVLSPSGFDDLTTDIPFGLEPLLSGGKGYSRGFEIFVQKKLSEVPFYGLISLSVSQTRFISIEGRERPGAFDCPVIFNILGGYRIGQDWEVSSKFRLASGLPVTPYLPDGSLDYTLYNEAGRLPLFHSLDLRVDKRWNFSFASLITYIDVQNIYARKNVARTKWDPRTQAVEYSTSLGVFPTIGVSYEF